MLISILDFSYLALMWPAAPGARNATKAITYWMKNRMVARSPTLPWVPSGIGNDPVNLNINVIPTTTLTNPPKCKAACTILVTGFRTLRKILSRE